MALATMVSSSYMHRTRLQAATLLSPPHRPHKNAKRIFVEQ
uniref:Uncharacterized protein n=1 Tax=Arundo donax TaxID=35708 RepID=A0A0A9D814_ARUDO